jgi:precorrin isomerase
MMTTVQKWLLGLIGLGALYLVVTNPKGFAQLATSAEKLTAGSVTSITTGGKKTG